MQPSLDPDDGLLKHRQFQSFLKDIEADFTEVLYHTSLLVKHGKSTKEGVGPQTEIVLFFNMKGISCQTGQATQSI